MADPRSTLFSYILSAMRWIPSLLREARPECSSLESAQGIRALASLHAHPVARLLLLTLLITCVSAAAAPFARKITYQQPGGPAIELWGEGDEFYAVFEALDGYTVIFDPVTKAYYYARVAADKSDFVSTGMKVGEGDPAGLGLAPHLRLSPEVIRAKVGPLRYESERVSGLAQRWQTLKATWHRTESGTASFSPPRFPTTGLKVGLTLLVDFEDEPGTIPQEEIVRFLNGDNYTGYNCNGSVKQFFADNSNGRLLFTNVVTLYVRIPNSLHPRSYYADVSRSCFETGRELLVDALNILKAQPNYTTEILPQFAPVTVDESGFIVSMNLFIAGPDSGVWTKGLWPGAQSGGWLGGYPELSAGGKRINRFQHTPMGNNLSLRSFCHENGHSMCGFPDLYDYDDDSRGGAGSFCSMGKRRNDDNPSQFCAYLKAAAGWATITDLNSASALTAYLSAGPGPKFNHFYRYRRPGVATEYFLLENRQQKGHDASLPGSGIAIWHIDELGNRDNQSLANNSSHANYEVTLEQADNQWHFQQNTNSGDACDLYFANNRASGYSNVFSDSTFPGARWWDGTTSGLCLYGFGGNADTMSFQVRPLSQAAIVTVPPFDQTTFPGGTAVLQASAGGSAPMYYQWYQSGTAIPGATGSTLVLSNLMVNQRGISVMVSNAYGWDISPPARVSLVPVAAWGAFADGQCDVPADVTNVAAVAGGRWFTMALLSNGTVRTWGQNVYSQCDPPADLNNVSAISAGSYFGMALLSNGVVRLWGNDEFKQISGATVTNGVKAISAGQYHCLVLQSNGTVAAWGMNNFGQATVPEGLDSVMAISAGWQTSLALRSNGTVVAWGTDGGAETVPVGLSNVVAVAAGTAACLALRSDGTVLAWGTNRYGQLDIPAGLSNVVAIAGYAHCMALRKDGTVVAWGAADPAIDFGQAKVPAGLSNILSIASNGRHSLALLRMPTQPAVLCIEPACLGGVFRTKVQTVAGRNYYLEFKDSLGPGNWVALPVIPGDGQERMLIDPNPGPKQRFYRIRVE